MQGFCNSIGSCRAGFGSHDRFSTKGCDVVVNNRVVSCDDNGVKSGALDCIFVCTLKKSFAEKRDLIRRMAREALEEDEKGETLLLDDLL